MYTTYVLFLFLNYKRVNFCLPVCFCILFTGSNEFYQEVYWHDYYR